MKFSSSVPDQNAKALALLRIGVGFLFLVFGQYKVLGTGFTLEGGFERWISRFMEGECYPFMAPVLKQFVLPNATPLAFLVAYGELGIGLSLISGVLVRVASAFGLLYMLALLFSSDYPGGDAAFWQYFGGSLSHLPLAMCFATFVAGRADLEFSLRSFFPRTKQSEEDRQE